MSHAHPCGLIVNADDFGMTHGINRAIGDLYDAGALTSATLMAQGTAFDDAVRIARERPGLGVGCHVVLVDGTPAANSQQVHTLLAPDGNLSPSLWRFALALRARKIQPLHIQREAEAQIAKLQDAGITVTHVDTHKHTHMFPPVAQAVMMAAQARGVHAIRNPFEPAWSRALSRAHLLRRVQVRVMTKAKRRFLQLAAENGMRTTDGCLGVAATGSLDAVVLSRTLRHLPEGTFELVCHPGYLDSDLQDARTRLRAAREKEREALAQVLPSLAPRLFHRITFADLTG